MDSSTENATTLNVNKKVDNATKTEATKSKSYHIASRLLVAKTCNNKLDFVNSGALIYGAYFMRKMLQRLTRRHAESETCLELHADTCCSNFITYKNEIGLKKNLMVKPRAEVGRRYQCMLSMESKLAMCALVEPPPEEHPRKRNKSIHLNYPRHYPKPQQKKRKEEVVSVDASINSSKIETSHLPFTSDNASSLYQKFLILQEENVNQRQIISKLRIMNLSLQQQVDKMSEDAVFLCSNENDGHMLMNAIEDAISKIFKFKHIKTKVMATMKAVTNIFGGAAVPYIVKCYGNPTVSNLGDPMRFLKGMDTKGNLNIGSLDTLRWIEDVTRYGRGGIITTARQVKDVAARLNNLLDDIVPFEISCDGEVMKFDLEKVTIALLDGYGLL